MKVWNNGTFENMEIGQRVLVAYCSSGRSYFGEFATLTRITARHLVFVTESGAEVKTAADNLSHVVGKAAKEHYWVSTKINARETDPAFIKTPVSFWDEKKRQLVKK